MPTPEETNHHYQQKALRYARAVTWIFGADVDTTTKERWAQAIELGRRIDSYIDNMPYWQAQTRIADIHAALDKPTMADIWCPALTQEALGAKKYLQMVALGHVILDLNAQYKPTTNVSDYIRLRRYEGRIYGRIIHTVATPTVESRPNYAHFAASLETVGEVANLTNSIHGIYGDFSRGEIALRPTPLVAARLAAAAVQSARLLPGQLLHSAILQTTP